MVPVCVHGVPPGKIAGSLAVHGEELDSARTRFRPGQRGGVSRVQERGRNVQLSRHDVPPARYVPLSMLCADTSAAVRLLQMSLILHSSC